MFAWVALLTALVWQKPEGARGESNMQLKKKKKKDFYGVFMVSEKVIMVPSSDLTILFD